MTLEYTGRRRAPHTTAPRVPVGGWTGVDWSARTTDRLSRDLLGGAGSAPLRDAARVYGHLAKTYGTAAATLDRCLRRLDDAVRLHRERSSGGAGSTLPLHEYARWLANHSAHLTEFASALTHGAEAFDAAVRAMPGADELAGRRADRASAERSVLADGGILTGRLARFEQDERDAHARAAAAMEGYEREAQSLRRPWTPASPPRIEAPRRPREKGRGADGSGGAGDGSSSSGRMDGGGVPAAPLSAYAAQTVRREGAETRPTVTSPATAAQSPVRGMPVMPAMLGAGAGQTRSGRSAGAEASAHASPSPDGEAYVVHAAPNVIGETTSHGYLDSAGDSAVDAGVGP